MGDTNLCYGCFEPIEGHKCPYCGFDQKSKCSSDYLVHGKSLSNGRYTIGKLLGHNGEGASYLAFDTFTSCKVMIREYMPDAICERDSDNFSINVKHNNLAQYKSLMAEFVELNQKLAKLKTINNINSVIDLFSENNTTYVVYEYIEGVNLIQYLKENAGELSWNQVSKMFPPLFTSLSILHNANIVHRGISPKTIYVTNKGELKLTDFCIATVRTAGNELNYELFKGYAAPEQYDASSWQGAWTDVYGICSVLYRILTGCMPTEATLRNDDRRLTTPESLNPDIPANVSNAIMEGLRLNGENRIRTITELVTKIFEPQEENRTVGSKIKKSVSNVIPSKQTDSSVKESTYSDKITERREKNMPVQKAPNDNESGNIFDKIKFPIFIIALLIIVVIILVWFFKSMMPTIKPGGNAGLSVITPPPVTTPPAVTEDVNTQETTSPDNGALVTLPPETTPPVYTDVDDPLEANIQMVDLVGKNYDEIQQYSTLAQYITLQPEYIKSEEYTKGTIISQSIPAGSWMSSGDTVVIQVSKGSFESEVPDYKTGPVNCHKVEDYLAILDEMGIAYRAIPQVNNGYHSGYVIGTEPKAGTTLGSGDVLTVHFTDNSGNGQVICSPGVSATTE